jgi:hypothetical protein
MRSSWGLSLVFGSTSGAAIAPSCWVEALACPEPAVVQLPAGASSELLLVEAGAGTGIRHTEPRS